MLPIEAKADILMTSTSKYAPSVIRSMRSALSQENLPYITGRNAIQVAEDLLLYMPDVAKRVILEIPTMQGVKYNPIIEEEPGKVHHEDLTNYISIDATPHYLRLLSRYCDRYGKTILKEEVTRKDGTQTTVRDSAEAALDFIVRNITASRIGLLEFNRINPKDHSYQGCKDESVSTVHPNGEIANYNAPIASLEVQALTYDALKGASKLFPLNYTRIQKRSSNLFHSSEKRLQLDIRARGLQERVLERFWMKDENFFAQALDRHPKSRAVRQVKILSSNNADLLESDLLADLPAKIRSQYIYPLLERLTSAEFLTEAGLRERSLQHQGLTPYSDYQGVNTSRAKETARLVNGLSRHGLPELATAVGNIILNDFSRNTSELLHDCALSALVKIKYANSSEQKKHQERLRDWVYMQRKDPITFERQVLADLQKRGLPIFPVKTVQRSER